MVTSKMMRSCVDCKHHRINKNTRDSWCYRKTSLTKHSKAHVVNIEPTAGAILVSHERQSVSIGSCGVDAQFFTPTPSLFEITIEWFKRRVLK